MRQRLYAEVETERQVQDSMWGGAAHDDQHTPSEWIGLLVRHVGLAVDDGSINAPLERFRRQMIRVAALALAAVEALDRKTGRQAVAGPFASGSGF